MYSVGLNAFGSRRILNRSVRKDDKVRHLVIVSGVIKAQGRFHSSYNLQSAYFPTGIFKQDHGTGLSADRPGSADPHGSIGWIPGAVATRTCTLLRACALTVSSRPFWVWADFRRPYGSPSFRVWLPLVILGWRNFDKLVFKAVYK